MNLRTKVSRAGRLTGIVRLYGAGIRVWRVAPTGVLAALILLTVLMVPASAQDKPGVEAEDGTVRVGGEVFAGDGCARAGDVTAGDCDEKPGSAKGEGGSGSDGSTKAPEEASDRSREGGSEPQSGEESDPGENASKTAGTTSLDAQDESIAGTTVTETTATDLAETTGPADKGSTAAGKSNACPVEPPEDARTATVARVIDGDTVELREPVDGYERVRLIGVDAPEMEGEDSSPERGAEEARAFTAEALEGEEVVLETDEEIEDPYGRLLAYLWIPEDAEADAEGITRPEFFNRTLVTQGHADVMTVEPNDAYAECLAAAEDEPQEEASSTVGESPRDGGDKGENEGLLGRLRDLVSSEESSGDQPTADEDQYGQGGTTAGPLPAETTSAEGLQGGTSTEGTAFEPAASSTSEQYGRSERQEPEVQEPVQERPAEQPARSSELGEGPKLPDSTPDELAAPESAPPVQADDTDFEADAGPPSSEAPITTLPETAGVSFAQLVALPAGALLVCSGLLIAFFQGLRQTRRNDSGG